MEGTSVMMGVSRRKQLSLADRRDRFANHNPIQDDGIPGSKTAKRKLVLAGNIGAQNAVRTGKIDLLALLQINQCDGSVIFGMDSKISFRHGSILAGFARG